ncbi:MAG: hypothetical protein ABGW69_00665 [Nanoarchaeota archaeon]
MEIKNFPRWKKKLLFILTLGLLFNTSFAFYLAFGDINVHLNITDPAAELYLNYNNKYNDSLNTIVISIDEIQEGDSINIDKAVENKNVFAMPFYLKTDNLPNSTSFNISLEFFSAEKNATNLFEVWLAYVSDNDVNCSDGGTELGDIIIADTDEKRKLCGTEKYTDENEESEYFNTVEFNIDNPQVVAIRINPFYTGDINISAIVDTKEIIKNN